jgi:hypothetical protein
MFVCCLDSLLSQIFLAYDVWRLVPLSSVIAFGRRSLLIYGNSCYLFKSEVLKLNLERKKKLCP